MIVLVTGGTRGLGRAIVEGIAARAAGGEQPQLIFLGCRDAAVGAELASKITSASGVQVEALVLDVADADSVAAAAETVAAKCVATGHKLDAIVNNAGVLLERDGCNLGDIVEPSMRVNYDSVCLVTDAFAPLVCDGGQIINMSSGAGTRATAALSEATRAELDAATGPALRSAVTALAHDAAALPRQPGETPIYALSKVAVNYFTRLVARETPRLRVNACSPGFCRTEIAGRDVVYTREPKDAALGADVVLKLLFGDLGARATGTFFKECSVPGTPLEAARSVAEPWVA